MSRHDLKARKVQLEIIENREGAGTLPITTLNKIEAPSVFPKSAETDYAQMYDLNAIDPAGSLKLWALGSQTDLDKYVTHMIGTDELLFRSNIDNNTSEPSLSNADWQYIGFQQGDLGGHGTFITTDTGQATILIPHGLGAIPSYVNPVPKNSFAWALSRSEINADITNIIITPAFTNNDGATLSYYWEAKI